MGRGFRRRAAPPIPPPPPPAAAAAAARPAAPIAELPQAPRISLADALRKLVPPPTAPTPIDPPAIDDEIEQEAPLRRPIPSGWTKIVGPRLAHVVLNLTERAAMYTSTSKKFEAGDIEDDTREYCDAAMADALEAWFPAAALTPGKQLVVAFGLAFGEQWIGRREIEPKKPSLSEPPPRPVVHAAATPTPAATPAAPDLGLVPFDAA